MELPQDIFRAYDIRGEVPAQINPEVLTAIARAYATRLTRELGRPPRIIVGRDLRPSSEELCHAAVEGLLASGASVLDVGRTPTPVMYFAIDAWGADGGLGLTASHKPPQFNGLKVRHGSGPFFGDQLQELYREALAGDFAVGLGSYAQRDVWAEYFAAATSQLEAGAARGLKVVLDLGNGCATLNARQLVGFLQPELVTMFEEPDGTFPGRGPDPIVEEAVAALAGKVRETGADLGIAIDADGDRVAVVDDQGAMIWPDRYVTPLCRQILRSGPATFVTEVRCTRALLEDVEQRGGRVKMTACGYPFILAGMAEVGSPLGFETSGHCYFGNRYLKYDDAAFAAARLLAAVAASGESMRSAVESLPTYYTAPEARRDCSDEAKFAVVQAVADSFRGKQPMLETDGVRLEFPDGWGLVRASNTGAELVLRWEGRSESARDRIGEILLHRVDQALQEGGRR